MAFAGGGASTTPYNLLQRKPVLKLSHHFNGEMIMGMYCFHLCAPHKQVEETGFAAQRYFRNYSRVGFP